MKRLVLIVFILSGGLLFGQEESTEFRTIFGNNLNIESGGYGAPEFKFGKVNDQFALLLGGKGGWVINHRFTIGGGGYGMTTNNTFNYIEDLQDIDGNPVPDSSRRLDLGMGYGGIFFEYVLNPKKAFHLTFPLFIGAGGAQLGVKSELDPSVPNYQDYTTYEYVESSGFFVLEPGMNIELNMSKFFRLNVGASYRYISATDLQRLSGSDLSGFSFNLGLKFGKF
ncbi:MAG: hypothetical protein R2750_13325 [Bacteroidales bacterium]